MLLPAAGWWLRVFANYGPWLYNHLGSQMKLHKITTFSLEIRFSSGHSQVKLL